MVQFRDKLSATDDWRPIEEIPRESELGLVCLICKRGHTNDILEAGKLYRIRCCSAELDLLKKKSLDSEKVVKYDSSTSDQKTEVNIDDLFPLHDVLEQIVSTRKSSFLNGDVCFTKVSQDLGSCKDLPKDDFDFEAASRVSLLDGTASNANIKQSVVSDIINDILLEVVSKTASSHDRTLVSQVPTHSETQVDNHKLVERLVVGDSFAVHYFCVLFSCEAEQRGQDHEGLFGFLPEDILKQGFVLRQCFYCSKSGASSLCSMKNCHNAFHYTCGLDNDAAFYFFGKYSSRCHLHKSERLGKSFKLKECKPTQDRTCMCCLDEIIFHEESPDDEAATKASHRLVSACCGRYFHRDCIQRMALTHGKSHFQCPYCKDKSSFLSFFLRSGIYIPCGDAEWEMKEFSDFYGYQDLHNGYTHCDARLCKCKEGRTFSKDWTLFEVIPCRFCGKTGVHVECGNMSLIDPVYECKICTAIVKTDRQKSDEQICKTFQILPSYVKIIRVSPTLYSSQSKKLKKSSKIHNSSKKSSHAKKTLSENLPARAPEEKGTTAIRITQCNKKHLKVDLSRSKIRLPRGMTSVRLGSSDSVSRLCARTTGPPDVHKVICGWEGCGHLFFDSGKFVTHLISHQTNHRKASADGKIKKGVISPLNNGQRRKRKLDDSAESQGCKRINTELPKIPTSTTELIKRSTLVVVVERLTSSKIRKFSNLSVCKKMPNDLLRAKKNYSATCSRISVEPEPPAKKMKHNLSMSGFTDTSSHQTSSSSDLECSTPKIQQMSEENSKRKKTIFRQTSTKQNDSSSSSFSDNVQPKRKRGRPPKKNSHGISFISENSSLEKPPRNGTQTKITKERSGKSLRDDSTSSSFSDNVQPKRKRGRPPKKNSHGISFFSESPTTINCHSTPKPMHLLGANCNHFDRSSKSSDEDMSPIVRGDANNLLNKKSIRCNASSVKSKLVIKKSSNIRKEKENHFENQRNAGRSDAKLKKFTDSRMYSDQSDDDVIVLDSDEEDVILLT